MATHKDSKFDWARKRIFRNAWMFPQWIKNAAGPIGSGTGACALGEINGKFVAAQMTATTDIVADLFMLPYDVDHNKPFYVRIYWATAATPTTDTVSWVTKYGQLSNASALAIGTTALDTAITLLDVSAGANKINQTSWGTIAKDTLEPGKLISFHHDITAATLTIATESVYLIGYEMEYSPRFGSDMLGASLKEAEQRYSIAY